MGGARGKSAGYHGWPIFLANGVQRRWYFWYVKCYVGLVQHREKPMSRRTITRDKTLVPCLGLPSYMFNYNNQPTMIAAGGNGPLESHTRANLSRWCFRLFGDNPLSKQMCLGVGLIDRTTPAWNSSLSTPSRGYVVICMKMDILQQNIMR